MTFRTPTWFRFFLGALCVGAILMTLVSYRAQGLSVYALGFGAFSLLVLVGLADAVMTRVTVDEGGLTRVAGFRRLRIPRHDIESVTWEAGAGVAVRLKRGSWVKLPEIGNSQARANSLRAWLKRTAANPVDQA